MTLLDSLCRPYNLTGKKNNKNLFIFFSFSFFFIFFLKNKNPLMWKYIWRRNGRGGSCWWWWAMAELLARRGVSSSLRNHTHTDLPHAVQCSLPHDFHWNQNVFYLPASPKLSMFYFWNFLVRRIWQGRESFGFRLTALDDGRLPPTTPVRSILVLCSQEVQMMEDGRPN